MWLSHNTQIFQKSASIVKTQILNTPVFNCVLLISTFAFNIEKYYIVWRSCFFTIHTNSWKFQVSWFNHVKIPPSKFWFSNWSHNPAKRRTITSRMKRFIQLPREFWFTHLSELRQWNSYVIKSWCSNFSKISINCKNTNSRYSSF